MPWTETVTMQRLDFIRACLAGTHSVASLCRQFGISRKTGYKWLERFDPGDLRSLENLSRARLTSSCVIPPDLAQLLISLRRAHPDWGPKKLRHWLINTGHPGHVPAASTIGSLLAHEGLVTPRKVRRRTPGNAAGLTDICRVNQVWSADFKGWFRLRDRSLCRPFTLTDNLSRYLLACEAGTRETGAFVRQNLERAFREYGLPDVIRTDNGHPFAGTGIAGLSRLNVWLIKLGILPERIRKGHPEENGRHERMHRSLKGALACGNIFTTQAEQQAWFDAYRREFNAERPHEAHGGKTPSSVWTPSARGWDGEVPEVKYPEGSRLLRVQAKGGIKLDEWMFLSEALRGEYVRLVEVDDGVDVILFDRLILAYYERAEKRIIRVDPA